MAHLAYLDAGSGSMILAALAGGVAGIAVVFKTYWRRIVAVFSKSKRAEFEAEDAAKAAADAAAEAGPNTGAEAAEA